MKSAIKKYLTQKLPQLNDTQANLVHLIIFWMIAKRAYWRSPRYARLAYWYVPTTFATLAAFPPAPTLPPVVIPLAATFSFLLAYILSAFVGLKI